MKYRICLVLAALLILGAAKAQKGPIDAKATSETKGLYNNLHKLAEKHTLFGHQHATEYGHGWSGGADTNRSDVKSVTGSHPAVIGFDFNALFGGTEAVAQRNTTALRKVVTSTYNRGGVITIAWHMSNPVSPTDFYWNDSTASPAVRHIIPGGSHHDKYKQILKTVAGFAQSCKGADGTLAPMIFRPFHEFDGDWFWWGARHCTRDEFISLWRFTVSYLRDSLGVHNFLYAFSPDNKFITEAQFLDRYPGDEWVDMVGMDNYGDMGRDGKYNIEAAIKKLSIVDAYAKKAGKLAAFTETGLESIPNPTWFTETLLRVMRASDFKLSYVLVWRNDTRSATHYYAPFPNHSSVPDFMKFYNDPYTLFENDLKNIYSGVSHVAKAAPPGKSFVQTADGVIVYPDPLVSGGVGAVRLQVINDKVIRVTASPQTSFPAIKSLITIYKPAINKSWTTEKQSGKVLLKTRSLTVIIQLSTGAVSFFTKEGTPVLMERQYNGRNLTNAVFEGRQSYGLTQTFETTANDAFYGLGQHQDGVFNYKSSQVFLFQNNTEVAVPFLVSNKNYGILWDNYSLTKVGDTRDYLPLSALKLYSKDGGYGWLTASYANNKDKPEEIAFTRAESAINYPYLDDTKQRLPKEFKPETGTIAWEGFIASDFDGDHKFFISYAGAARVWIDGKLLVDRWRQAWNPGSSQIFVNLKRGQKVPIKIWWSPDGGESYLSVKWLSPIPAGDMNTYSFSSEAGQHLDYYFIKGSNMDEVISGYRTLTGKATVAPKWAMGFWQSRERYKTQEEIVSTAAEFRKRSIPLDAIVQDWSYWKEPDWGSQDFDATRFPFPDTMIADLHRQNTKLMISVWPKFYEGIQAYKDFDAKGWLYKRNIADRQRDWIGKGYVSTFYDAFNGEAKKGFWELINKKLYGKGVDAWWMDASEPDILSNVSPERRKEQMSDMAAGIAAEYLNAYPLENAKGIFHGQRSTDNDKRVFLLTRSGFAGSQHYGACIWSGDISSTWGDMKTQISAGLNFSMSGIPFWTMDIGGFAVHPRYEKPNAADLEEWRELQTRWFQFGAFVPLFRSHGQFPFREVFHLAPEDHPAYKSMVYYNNLRYRMLPYIYTLAGMTYHSDYTIMRGLVMDFPKDTAVKNIGDQYMFGPSLLISPVYTYKERAKQIYLPAGQGWYDLYTGGYKKGGQAITVDAPYERMPVMVKEGSILPFGPALQYTDEKQADTITLYVYTGKDASFKLYEDENSNYNYEKGAFSNIPFSYNEAEKQLTIGGRQGSFPGMLINRTFRVVWVTPALARTLDFAVADKTVDYHGKPIVIKMTNETPRIKLNQLGYYPYAPKFAIVTGETAATRFYIASTNLRDTLFSGTLSEEKTSKNSYIKTKSADFSSFAERGSFVVLIPQVGHSYIFTISEDANKPAALSTLRGFYYQRVSMPLEEKYAGKWHRSAGHPDDVVLVHGSAATKERPEGTVISSPGGWYDAGDYNKYIVNSGITMGTLLSAFEDFPAYFKTLRTNIPESSDAVPDLLNEAIYNLRWMLTMQDPTDGGVYNKCTNAAFDGMVMPGITRAPRYVVQKGTAATLDFAAVTAQAARILKSFSKQLPGLADSCLTAAKKAWAWSLKNPSQEYNQESINKVFKPVISTGGYGDRNFTDEWLWAATELYVTTKEAAFGEAVKKYMRGNIGLPAWGSVGMMGYYSALRFSKEVPVLKDSLPKMRDRIISMADGYLQNVSGNAFATVMGGSPRDFGWGSNSNAGNQGILLIKAYLLTNDKKYVNGALTNVDYLLGRNATGYCFVTGLGSKSPMFPHHRPSAGDGIVEPVPGLLAGGPNPGKQDKCTYEFSEPETTYADVECSYASNEIAINWNAPIVYLANAIEALKEKVGYTSKR